MKGGRFTKIPVEAQGLERRIYRIDVYHLLPGVIGTSVIDENNFIGKPVFLHDAVNPLTEFRDRLLFVLCRNNNGYVHSAFQSVA